jgi:hypothetical protein
MNLDVTVTTCPTDLTQLRTISPQTTEPNKTIVVMELAPEDDNIDVVSRFGITLPYTDEYVFYYPRDDKDERTADTDDTDLEPDATYNIPKLIRTKVQLDVPYSYVKDYRAALSTAWKHASKGDHIVLITNSPNDALDLLQQVAQSESHEPGSTPKPTPYWTDTLTPPNSQSSE